MIRSIRYFGVGINSGLLQLQDLWDLAHQNRLIRSLDSTQNYTTKTKIEGQRRGRQVRNNHSSHRLQGARDRPGQQRNDGKGSRNPKGDTVLPKGIHVYKFSLNIPQGSVPSSFKGPHGKIVYKLEAKLSRSWRMDQSVEQKILFVSRCYPNLHSMMLPQIGATKKEMGLFSKGQADMEVTIDRMAYAPGETITVLAKINNSSSSEMTPKFRLDKKLIYRASGSTKLEYHLKAYLDISFAFDPEVLFPLVVVPLGFAPVPQPGVAAGPYPAGAVGGPSNSDFPPPAVSGHPYPVSPSSGRSGNPGAPMHSAPPPPVYPGNPMVFPCPPSVYPAQPAHVSGGYNNQVPEIPFPYGTPFSSSVIHPPPTAPTFQTPPAAPAIPPAPSLPAINPPPSFSPFNVSPTAPSYNLMNTDFLGQSDEAPPAYTLLFPSTATDKSDAK
ncbi:Arrestin domain containing protein 4 [Dissostichus eleginoides]|uniref:Arrestin domain containing protein 4 n=1 Tax=Dissostichus eleginoides TaxID=100907 RepID=A0AAD9BXW6_DISEL|nr:Arrestin domain containing protein 4 [Dissostichus eleginoides]